MIEGGDRDREREREADSATDTGRQASRQAGTRKQADKDKRTDKQTNSCESHKSGEPRACDERCIIASSRAFEGFREEGVALPETTPNIPPSLPMKSCEPTITAPSAGLKMA